MPKKIHVTGANGYIGSLLVNYLQADGHFVDLAKYRIPKISANSIDADIVIHLAMAGGDTIHKPRAGNNDLGYMKKVYIDGIKALLDGLKRKTTKIIFLSSTAVYGKFDDSPFVKEKSDLLPISDYWRHKLESEAILKQSEFDWMILRPYGVFGPSTGNNLGNSFLNTVIEHAIKNKEVTVLGGDQLIDTVYILDLISIILRSSDNEWHSREIYNVGGETVRVKDMLTINSDSLNKVGLRCPLVTKAFKGKPAILTDATKLKSAFQNYTNTPLKNSLHALLSAYLLQYSVLK